MSGIAPSAFAVLETRVEMGAVAEGLVLRRTAAAQGEVLVGIALAELRALQSDTTGDHVGAVLREFDGGRVVRGIYYCGSKWGSK